MDSELPNVMKSPESQLPVPNIAKNLQNLDVPLYEGAGENQTLLRSLMLNVLIFVGNHGLSLTALDQSIRVQKANLPSPNVFPSNWYEAEKILAPYMPPLTVLEACSNDCMVYTKYQNGTDYTKLTTCLHCGNERKGSGKKIIHYYSLTKRFERDFGEPNIVKLCHAGKLTMDLPSVMRDFQDSKAFHSWYSSGGVFDGYENSSIPLGLFADGQNPNRNINIDHSMWPLILVNFAMKKEFRTTLGPMMLYAIVPGKRGGGEPNLEPYLEIAIDDLLAVDNMVVHHSILNAPLRIKTRFLHYMCDIPAFAKIMNTVGQAGLSACTYCWHKGTYCTQLDKCIHLGHRRFLPENHPLRKDDTRFVDGREHRPKPSRITAEEEIKLRRDFDKSKTKKEQKERVKQYGYRSAPALSKAPDFNRSQQQSPDIMHTVGDVCSTTLKMVNGTLDSAKVRQAEESFNRYVIYSLRLLRPWMTLGSL